MNLRERRAARQREDEADQNAIIVATGLQSAADVMKEAKKLRDSAKKRRDRANDDFAVATETITSSRAELDSCIRAAFELEIPKTRLLEVEGLRDYDIKRALSADPSQDVDTSDDTAVVTDGTLN